MLTEGNETKEIEIRNGLSSVEVGDTLGAWVRIERERETDRKKCILYLESGCLAALGIVVTDAGGCRTEGD